MNQLKTLKRIARLWLGTALVFAVAGAWAEPKRLDSGITLEVRGEGKPVLMIPGLNSAPATWDPTCAALQEEGYACHLVLLPGFAGSKPVVQAQFLTAMANGLLDYIHRAGLKQPVVMGHSLGGFVAMEMAIISADEPDKLGRLVIVDSLPFMPAAYNEQLNVESAKPMAESMRQNMVGADAAAREFHTRRAVSTMTRDPEGVDRLVKWGMASDQATSAQAMYELMTRDLRPQLSKITQPTLVLGAWAAYQNYGQTKQGVESLFERQYANIANLKLAISETGYHFLMWDDPEWFMDEVTRFLK